MLNSIQVKIGVHRWRKEGIVTVGHVLQADEAGVVFASEAGPMRLHHHRPRQIGTAIARHGSAAVLLDQGVLVITGAGPDAAYRRSSSFSVATTASIAACRVERRPGDPRSAIPLLP